MLVLAAFATSARAETVNVEYRGPVDLTPFDCTDVSLSSFIKRVCYDTPHHYMVIALRNQWYHYCRIDNDTVQALLNADSMGRYYNETIRGNFDCRQGGVPE